MELPYYKATVPLLDTIGTAANKKSSIRMGCIF